MRVGRLAGCLGVVGLFSACSGSGSSSSSSGGVSAAAACDAEVDAECGFFQRCIPAYLTLSYGDLATCKTRSRLNCEAGFTKNGVTRTPTQAKACADAFSTASCSDIIAGNTPSACNSVPGTLSNGTTCGMASQCSSTACRFSANSTCGTCSALVNAGGSCANGEPCAENLTCAANGNCVSPGAAGATCGTNSPCKGGLICNNGTCGSPVGAGGTCDPQARNCDSLAGLWCNSTNNQCQAFAFANAGSPCGYISGGLTLCSAAGTCNTNGGTTGTCVAAAADGATCNTNNGPDCMGPASCINGSCQLPGTSCN